MNTRRWHFGILAVRYNDGNFQGANALAADRIGNVFVTGYSHRVASCFDYATIAYSADGVALWTNRYNGPGNDDDYSFALAADGTGNVFVTGKAWNGSSYDYATIAYSISGVPLWTNLYNGPENGYDEADAVAVDGRGNVFVAGYSLGSGSGYDYATVAYSNAGVPMWTNVYNGKTRVFSTTLGHNNDTVADDKYLDLVTRGLLWATGHLNDDGTPATGYGVHGK